MNSQFARLICLCLALLVVIVPLAAQDDDPAATVDVFMIEDSLTYDIAVSPDASLAAVYNGKSGTILLNVGRVEYEVDPAQTDIRIVDLDSGEVITTLTGNTDYIWDVAFSLDGSTLASVQRNGVVSLWDVATGEMLRDYPVLFGVQYLEYLSDGRLLLTHAIDPIWQFLVMDLESGHVTDIWRPMFDSYGKLPLNDPFGRLDTIYPGFAASTDGTALITASGNGEVVLWDTTTLEQQVLQPQDAENRGRLNIRNVRFSDDGTTIYYFDRTTEQFHIWDVTTATEVGVYTIANESFAVSSTTNVVAWTDDTGVWMADLDDPTQVTQLASTPLPARSNLPALAFSQDGSRLVIGAPGVPLGDAANMIVVVNLTSSGE